MNAIATVCARLMPAILPPCATYWEDGANFLHGENIRNLMEVSTDGTITLCDKKSGCKHLFLDGCRVILLECKCPYPKQDGITIHYEIPLYYSCQLLAGMKVKSAEISWYVTYSSQSLALIILYFDEDVWKQVWHLIQELLDENAPKMPRKKNAMALQLKTTLRNYIEKRSKFVAEIPSMVASEVAHFDVMYDDAYLQSIPSISVALPMRNIIDNLSRISIDGACLTEEGFQLLRKKSVEILGFVLTNSDREKSPNSLAHIPVAYAMKGNSLPTEVLRKLLDIVRDKCKKEQIRVICEVCDGQWNTLVVKDRNGGPLTHIQFQKSIWLQTLSMSKDQMLDFLSEYSAVDSETLDQLESQIDVFLTSGRATFGRIQVVCEFVPKRSRGTTQFHRKFTLLTVGGPQSNVPVMRYIRTIPHTICPHIWKSDIQNASEVTTSDVFSKLPADVQDDALHLVDGSLPFTQPTHLNNSDSEDEIATHPNTNDDISGPSNILHEMLEALIKLQHRNVWEQITPKILFTDYMQDAKIVAKSFIHKELDALNKVYKKFFKQNLFKSSDLKETKVNRLVGKFGKGNEWFPSRMRKSNPKTLLSLAKDIIKSKRVPKSVIACPVAFLMHRHKVGDWKESFTVPNKIPIPHKGILFDLYSFPEYNASRDQLEPKCLDVTHILTNLRAHSCKHGLQDIDKDAWMRVCEKDAKYLPRPIIEDIVDQQNAEYAKKVFSSKVQKIMEMNGDFVEAKYVKTVRQWYKACDERGLLPEERIDRFLAMHRFLTEDRTFTTYPPASTHVKGLPIVTYEGILHNISMRLILYSIANNNTYNQRSVSTLGIESFFADLSRAEFTQTGCPKACQIPKLMSAVCEINTHKHNPNKGFTMDQRRGAPYPQTEFDYGDSPQLASTDKVEVGSLGIYNPHKFDIFQRTIKRRCKYKPNIALPNETERGKLGIRSLYRRNEFQMTTLQRLSLPKNFEN